MGFSSYPPTTSEFYNGTLLIRFQMHNLNHPRIDAAKARQSWRRRFKAYGFEKKRGEIALAEIFTGQADLYVGRFAELYSQY